MPWFSLSFSLLSNQEEGLKLTFSKQALMPNGSGAESSSRKKRKDQEVCVVLVQLLYNTQFDAKQAQTAFNYYCFVF